MVTVMATLVMTSPALADKLSDAIAKSPQGTGAGNIDPSGRQGLPGHSRWSYALLVGWSGVGDLGGLDLFHRRGFRRHYGRRRSYERIRPG